MKCLLANRHLTILSAVTLLCGATSLSVSASDTMDSMNLSENAFSASDTTSAVDESMLDEADITAEAFDLDRDANFLTENAETAPTPAKKAARVRCQPVKLDTAQRTQLEDLATAFKKDAAPLRKAVQESRLAYAKLAGTETADLAAAETASAAVVAASGKLTAASFTLRNNVMYKVLRPEQRASAHACMLLARRIHRHRALAGHRHLHRFPGHHPAHPMQ